MAQDSLELFDDSDMTMMMTIIMMVIMMSIMIPIMDNRGTLALASGVQTQSYEGNEDPRTLHVTSRLQWLNFVYDYPFKGWVSAFIINDGPNSVELGINFPDDRFIMNPGETRTIVRTGAQDRINILFYICSTGLTSSVRVTGVY